MVLLSMTIFAQVEKIEPPFWWAGMQHSEVQLMVYGQDIAQYEVAFANTIQITDVVKTENPNYMFVTINTKNVDAGTYELQFLKDDTILGTQSYELKARRDHSASRKGFDSSDLIYLVMPDRFSNGNSDNDSTDDTIEEVNRAELSGRHGGDIQGIINHLDYLDELGVTALWSTPLLEDNEPIHSYHTYAQSDYYKIDPRYGTNDDYKRLASELHQRDMKLLMDYVTNHWGSKHWMIQDLPSKDWINFWDSDENGFERSSHRMTTQFDSNASESDKKACMNGWFDTSMPDINQKNPLVLTYLIQNAIWWVEFTDLDGFRVDTYSYNDKEGIAKWTKAIMDEYPKLNIAGEVWMHNQAQMAYWQKDSKIGAIDNYNSHLPTVMDFTLHDALILMFAEDEQGWDKGMLRAYENFANDFLYPDINNILVFAGNHDTNRINEIYKADLNTYKMIMTMVATVRGIPQVYYGDELGMGGNKDLKGDGDIRHDFPGGWEGDPINAFTAEGRTPGQTAFFEFSKKVFNWRKSKSAIHKGKTMQFVPENNVYVYFRYTDEERVMVVINNNPEAQTLELKRFKEMIKLHTSGWDILSEQQISLENTLQVDGKTAMIIEF
ncbi:glycoside hydrolase family 13 protein [Gelidibacter salicanalis]|uniref:Glycoside hydrolase family 13 protein n=1 Tax=Gelidibacter salicanalis TaxID=291193 RepID=A0A934KMV8_9FLAO|nr:glycoside hydrolase family 13 protein [Gelidibacter salicanalis]MBJ7882157.1 glycoside hydrolase family 13 protein [Gelidibacter salicanalis]